MIAELRDLLAESVTKLFAAEVTPELLSAADAGTWPAELWDTLCAAGYPQLFADGDDDVSWEDAYPLVFAAGAALAPVPLPEMLLASWLLQRVGIEMPDGIITVVPQRAGEAWNLVAIGGHMTVSGRASAVSWGARASHVVLVAASSAGLQLVLLETKDLTIAADRNAASEPRDTIVADGAPIVAALPLGDLPDDIIERFGALLRAAQIAGAVQRVLRLAASYAKERHQFGRPLAAFQAVSQQLAVLAEEAVAAEVAASMAWRAAASDPCTRAIAVAKIRAGKAAGVAPAIAHAVFGAIGITAEHSLHFASRRLWSWRAEFGHEARWARELGAAVLRDGGDHLWSSVTGKGTS